MEIFKFFGSIKSLRGFSAPDSLVAISRLGYGVLGLAATKVAMEIIPGFMIIKALDKLLPSPRRLTKEVSLGRILSDTQEWLAPLITIGAQYEAGIVGSV